MKRAIKIRLYPNKEQEQTINKVLGCYRFVYNQALAQKKNAYNTDKISLTRFDLVNWFHRTLRKEERYPWLKEQNTNVMEQAIRQMLTAYDKFFKQHNGFPKFKSKKDKQSATFPKDAISKRNTFEDKHITLIKSLKNIKFRCSNLKITRLQKYKNNFGYATLSKTKSGKYELSILVEMEDGELKRFDHTGKDVGIDLGLTDFVITSDGEKFANRKCFKKEKKKIKKLQRQLSKKIKGSNNRNKARIKLAKAYEKITNRRKYYAHQVATKLLKDNDVVFMEDLNVKGMIKNHYLASSIQDVSWSSFREILEHTANDNSKHIGFVDRFYPSSKTCHCCGYRKKKMPLNIREWTCPNCGIHHDRDVNAAINMLQEGRKKLCC
jgi:putative transposase